MKTRKFKYELAQKVYNLYRVNPPVRRGSQMSSNYFNGYEGLRCFGDRGSQCYAAHAAGIDNKAEATT